MSSKSQRVKGNIKYRPSEKFLSNISSTLDKQCVHTNVINSHGDNWPTAMYDYISIFVIRSGSNLPVRPLTANWLRNSSVMNVKRVQTVDRK